MHLDRVTVTDLIQALEEADPDAEVRLAQQPSWPFEYAVDPTNPTVEVDLDDGPVVYLAQGAQLGYLPGNAREQLGWQPPDEQQEPAMEFSPGDRVELVATSDPYTRLRPGDRGTVTSVTDRPEPAIEVQWDTGSTLAVLADAGDRIRQLPTSNLRPLACPPAAVSRPSPPNRQAGQAANRPDGRPGGATPTQPGRRALTP